MKQKTYLKRILCFTLSFVLLFGILPPIKLIGEEPETQVTTAVNLKDYIVFDLAKGTVTIGETYSGYVYTYNETDAKWELVSVSGKTRSDSDQYYIFQSTTKSSVTVNGDELTLVTTDIDNAMLVNNTDVQAVYDQWQSKATAQSKSPTSNYVVIDKASRSCNVTIDGIWSSNHQPSQSYSGKNGGIHVNIGSTANMQVSLRLRGDNRVPYFYYQCNNVNTSGLTVGDDPTDGDVPIGSLTVIGSSEMVSGANYSGIYQTGAARNNWNSVFGATDSTDHSYNLTFESGVIYAGAHKTENCTAIGGGGNGVGKVTINGGTITAVSHSTGTAIGGGIAHTGSGGNGIVTINGGEVYAYNFGLAAYDRVQDGQYGSSDSSILKASRHVPGTAIGGASSLKANGASGSQITITGGTVYAESLGGAGIGGGNTIVGTGGAATINISGGNVTARSTAQELIFNRTNNGQPVSFFVNAGAGIGGGNSSLKDGGSATVNITGGRVYSDGIGGGNSTKAKGGGATVTMDAGTVVSTGIGGGFSQVYGYAEGSVTVNGGSLNSSMAAVPKNKNGEILYLTRISFFSDTQTMSDERVELLTFGQSIAFSCKDVYSDSIGMIYLWLPENATVLNGRLTSQNDVNFTPNNESDKDIDTNSVGALIYNSTLPRYTVTIAGSNVYSLFLDAERTEYLSGSAIVEQGVFTYYLQIEKGYSLTPYVGTILADGSKIITPLDASAMTLVDETYNLYRSSVYVQNNVAVWYAIKNENSNEDVFSLDLTNGDITVTEAENGSMTISQNGYVLSGYTGQIFLTSAGFPTNNTVTVSSQKADQSNISIVADELNIISQSSAFVVESGSLNLSFGEKDNMIHSIDASPIEIRENAELNLSTEGKESIKLSTSAQKTPIIIGAGTLNLNNSGGFLTIQDTKPETSGVNQIAVGQYNFEGENDNFSTELYKGQYSYTVIGFMQENTLHSINETPDDNKMFSARGIYEIFDKNELSASSPLVNNGALTYTLTVKNADNTMGMYKITNDQGQDITNELKSAGKIKSTDKTLTVEIDGEYFKNGNITINAAVNNQIAYNVIVPDNPLYDGNGHGITVMLDESLFQVYYSEEKITAPDPTKTTPILKTNVAEYTVYFYICERANNPDPEREYEPAWGQASFRIIQSENAWLSELTCADIICGTTPTANAVSRWGEVSYTYYYGEAVITPAEIAAMQGTPEDPLEFSVIATVEGTDNYKRMESKRIYFYAIVLSAYAQSGRQLDKIVDGETGTLTIANSGAFSVYFSSTGSGVESNIQVGTALPIGTNVTLMVLSENKARYYFDTVAEADISDQKTTLKLNEFSLMGDQGTAYQPPEGESVEYQFCFEYRGLSGGTFTVCLNNQTKVAPTINCELSWLEQLQAIQTAQGTEEKIVVEGGYSEIQIKVKPKIAGTGYKFLAFTVAGTDAHSNEFSLVNMETALSVQLDNNHISELQPIASSDDFLLFRMGLPSETVDRNYTLVISNVPEGAYTLDITCDVRMSETDFTNHYALFGANQENHKASRVTVTVSEKTVIDVSLPDHDRLISSGNDTPVFELHANEPLAETTVSVSIYKKNGKNYEAFLRAVSIRLTDGNKIELSSEIIAQLENGTYRIQFDYGGATCYYNIVVQK